MRDRVYVVRWPRRAVLVLSLTAMGGCVGSPLVRDDPPRASTAPPAAAVTEIPLEDDAGTLYLPGEAAVPAVTPRPLVVLLPGFAADETAYRETSRALVAAGFVVAGLDHHFSFGSALRCMTQREGYENVRRAFHRLLREAGRPGAPLYGRIQTDKVGVIGHSYGGKLALWLASDEQLDAVVALDPVDGGGDRRPDRCPPAPNGFPRVAPLLGRPSAPPLLLLTAGRSGECAPSPGNGSALYDVTRDKAIELLLPGASHTDFLDAAAGFCLACARCPPSAEPKGAVLRFTQIVSARFLGRILGERQEMPDPAGLLPEGDGPRVAVRARSAPSP